MGLGETITVAGVTLPTVVVVAIASVLFGYIALSAVVAMAMNLVRALIAKLALRYSAFVILGSLGISLEALMPGSLGQAWSWLSGLI